MPRPVGHPAIVHNFDGDSCRFEISVQLCLVSESPMLLFGKEDANPKKRMEIENPKYWKH